MYKAAEYFSEDARRKVATYSAPFDRKVTTFGKGVYVNRDGCCIFGALLNAERLRAGGQDIIWQSPTGACVREALIASGTKPEAGAIPELIKANDRGLLSTPEAVRDALGV